MAIWIYTFSFNPCIIGFGVVTTLKIPVTHTINVYFLFMLYVLPCVFFILGPRLKLQA